MTDSKRQSTPEAATPASIPQREIREPLSVVHEYAMIAAGHVRRRREEVLDAENAILERYAALEADRDQWKRVARQYESALSDRGLL